MRQHRSIAARLALVGTLLAICRLGAETHTGPVVVTIVATTTIEAHKAAIEGIRAALAKTSEIRVVDLTQLEKAGPSDDRLSFAGTRVIIAVGTEALERVAAERLDVPVVSTMVLRNKPGGEPPALSPAATITLDVPLAVLLSRLKQVFPGKTRLGIIRNPNIKGQTATALEARAQQLGFSAWVADCPGPEQLLSTIQNLKGKVDFVWCLPDSALYNSATIKPLVLASIETRLPLIGFSESFARAGAAVGAYPDFRDVGLQTGEAAQQIISGQAVRPLDGPRKLKLAVNQSVLRLLGLRYNPAAAEGDDFAVLQ